LLAEVTIKILSGPASEANDRKKPLTLLWYMPDIIIGQNESMKSEFIYKILIY